MTDPREQALEAIRTGLERDPALFVALQYVGMLVPDALAPLRAQDSQLVDRILSVPPAPEPAYARARRRQPRTVLMPQTHAAPTSWPAHRTQRGVVEGGLFADWMDGKIEWSPEVMGWASDAYACAGMAGREEGRAGAV